MSRAGHGMDAARLARIPAFLAEKYVGPGRLPHAATMVVRRGETAHFSCIGDARPGQALREDALYRIASMTKPLTSLAFMMLVEEGRAALADPLVKYCPEFAATGVFVAGGGAVPFVTRPAAAPVRMVDLLRHTAGFTYGFQERNPVDAAYRGAKLDDFAADYSSDSFIARLAQFPLLFDPGAQWNYSVATDVLGVVIERITGQPLGAVLHDRIFAPLAMVDTGFQVPADQAHRLTDAFAVHPQHKMVPFDDGARSRWAAPRPFQSGGGGLVSSIQDYARFCALLLGGGAVDGVRLVSRKTLELMVANHLPGGGDLTRHSIGAFSEAENAGVGFGLGFAVTEQPAATGIPGSAGDIYWGGMFTTGFFVDPAEAMAILFMTQIMPSSATNVRREVKTLAHAAIAD